MKLNADKLKQVDFVQIIRESFVLAWQKKYLWWFGLFASLSSFNFFNFSFPSGKNQDSQINFDKAYNFIFSNPKSIFLIVLALLLFLILFFLLSIFFKGILIKSIGLELEQKKSNFKKGLHLGKKYFGKNLGLSLLSLFFFFGITLIIVTPIFSLFFDKNYFAASVLFLLAIIIIIPLFFLLYFLTHLGYLYIVLGKISIFQSIENSYALLQKNLASCLAMFGIFLVTGLIFFLFLFLIFAPLGFIFFLLGLFLVFISKTIGFILIIILGIFIFVPLFLALRAFYEVFYQAAWIKFFYAIAKPKEEESVEKVPEAKPLPTPDAVEGI